MNKKPSTRHLLHPDLLPLADAPDVVLSNEMLPGYRAEREATNILADVEALGVTRQEIMVPLAGEPDVRCLLYRPVDRPQSIPGYLHIHGGGYIMSTADGSDLLNALTASKLGITVLSVDYRLAPEHPIPAPLDDCYAALAWLFDHAGELGVDNTRIGIGGESAGGGLAAAVAIHARDQGQYQLCHQHLTYPMLDDTTGTADNYGDPLVGEFIWTREKNRFGWQSYLGSAPAEAPQVPMRVSHYEGLPPAWILTASMDLFRDENIEYARNLLKAGVAAELIVYPGACHGFQMLPGTELGSRFVRDHRSALARGLSVTGTN